MGEEKGVVSRKEKKYGEVGREGWLYCSLVLVCLVVLNKGNLLPTSEIALYNLLSS